MKPGRKKGTPKTGGRQKGTPNRLTADAQKMIEDTLGTSPFEKMARLVKQLLDGERREEPKAVEIAAKLLTELAQYCAPKRKAIELSGPSGGEIPLGRLTIDVVHSRNGNGNGNGGGHAEH